MNRIDVGFKVLKLCRSEIIDNYCPCQADENLPKIDIDTYEFETSCVQRGCRGITCEQCWDKPVDDDLTENPMDLSKKGGNSLE